ncbi:hypothetical protein FFLO_06280 [Filobasidium floriforme]|uniref:Myb-like domain-containing protein n=1 Tax=Filobasidium floriforme TaxID=5210 RepID=A0A8K0JH19_9TREE|nr:hypothetical protein FFLO_06280 [Filobasidium floriforme]
MSDRQVVLYGPIRPSSIHEPHETPQEPVSYPLIEDLDSDNLFVPTSTAAYFLHIDPSWNALQLRTAYSHLLRADNDGEQEHPEILLHNVAQPSFLDFVQAVEIGFKHLEECKSIFESSAGGSLTLQEAIESAGCTRWLSEGDVERVLDWVVKRGREMDLDMGYNVPKEYRGVVLNQHQFVQRQPSRCPSPPARPIGGQEDRADLDMTGSTADRAIALSDSDSDDDLASLKKKRRSRASSDDELVVTSSPTKKQRVRVREDSVAYVPSRTPTPSPSGSPPPSTTPTLSRNRSGSPARRTRWTAAQQFAMVSLLYTTGYEGADWEYIAGRVNAANPLGPAKTKSRVKSAMRETHWAGFLRNNANIEGRIEAGEVGMVMPDMSGPAPSNKPAWTGEQKEIVWAETFTHGERHVSWRDVAEAVNEAAAGQESLYRKSLDCEKTWKDTLRRHFGLQGRRR